MLNVKKSLDQHEAFLDIETLDPALVAGFIALAIPARKTKPLEISDYTEGSTDPNYKAKIPEPTILRMPSRLTRRYVPLRMEVAPRLHAESPFLITNAAIGITTEKTSQEIYFHDTEVKTEKVQAPNSHAQSQLIIESKSNIYERNNVVRETEKRHEIIKELQSKHENTIDRTKTLKTHTETSTIIDNESEPLVIDEITGFPTTRDIITEHESLIIQQNNTTNQTNTSVINEQVTFGYNEYLPSANRQVLLKRRDAKNSQLEATIIAPFTMGSIITTKESSRLENSVYHRSQGKQINESHSKAVNASITPLDTPLTNESNDSLLSVPKTKVLQTQETQVEYLKPNDKEQLSSESIVVEEVERFNDPIMNSSSVPSVVYSDVNPSKIDPVTASSTESQTIIQDNVASNKSSHQSSDELITQTQKSTKSNSISEEKQAHSKNDAGIEKNKESSKNDFQPEIQMVIHEVANTLLEPSAMKNETIFVTSPGKISFNSISDSSNGGTQSKSDPSQTSMEQAFKIEERNEFKTLPNETIQEFEVTQEVAQIEVPSSDKKTYQKIDTIEEQAPHQTINIIKPKSKSNKASSNTGASAKQSKIDDVLKPNISTRNESEAEILNRSTVATSQLFIDDVVKKYSYVRNEHDEIDFVLNNEESIPKTTQERKDAIARVQKRIENMIQTEAQAGKINIHKIELSENVSKDSQERESIVQETLSRAKEILDVPIQDLQLEQFLARQKFEAQFDRKLREALRLAHEEWQLTTKKMLVNLLEEIMRS